MNQIGVLLAIVVGAVACPSRSAIHRIVQAAGRLAGQVLKELDQRCKALVLVGCLDEIFFHGHPVLVGVEPASMVWFLGQKAVDRSGTTWHQALQPWDALQWVVADGGSGLQHGIRQSQEQRQQSGQPALENGRDVFHTIREAQQVLTRLWNGVERRWEEAEAADARVHRAQQQGRDGRVPAAQARAAWRKVATAFQAYERGEAGWRLAHPALGVFRPQGELNDVVWARSQIAAALPLLGGRAWSKVRGALECETSLTFLERMHRQLEEAEPDASLRGELVKLWCLRRQRPRGKEGPVCGSGPVAHLIQTVVCAKLSPHWQDSYLRVSRVLKGTVRASSAVECLNSVLRMHQSRHRLVSQELLDLKRLYWNCRVFHGGKRRGRSPYELLGLKLAQYDFARVLGLETCESAASESEEALPAAA